jgi:hypothetical protein
MAFDHASPPDTPCGATNQGTHHGVWDADAFAVTWYGTISRDVGLQMLENTALSRGIIGKSAPMLAAITIRKSQVSVLFVAFGKRRSRSGIHRL